MTKLSGLPYGQPLTGVETIPMVQNLDGHLVSVQRPIGDLISLTGAMVVTLFSQVHATTIPVGTDLIRVNGHAVTGLGDALYVAHTGDALDPAGEGVWWATSANGRIMKLASTPYATMFGARGDNTADDAPALQAFFDYVSMIGTALGGRALGIIPAGKYRCLSKAGPTSCVLVKQNSAIHNFGEIIHAAGGAVGGTVQVGRSQDNISWTGGVINANMQGNDNCIAISGLDSNGGQAEGIWIRDVILRHARHGGAFIPDPDAPGDVGRGGGKGFSVQAGPQRVVISGVLVEDCDIGFSVEGIVSNGGNTNDVNISDVTVRGAKYMGMLLAGYTQEPDSQTITSVNLSNIFLDGCCVGQATNFGVIHGAVGVGIVGRNIRIRNETGAAVTPIRGTFRQCDLEVFGDCYAVKDAIDLHNGGGYANLATQSQNNRLKLSLKVRNSASGYVLNLDPAFLLRRSQLDLRWLVYDGADLLDNPWPGSGIFAVQPQRTSYRLEDMSVSAAGLGVAQSDTDEAPVFGQTGLKVLTAASVLGTLVKSSSGQLNVANGNVATQILAAGDIPRGSTWDFTIRTNGGTGFSKAVVTKAVTDDTLTVSVLGHNLLTLAADGGNNLIVSANIGLTLVKWTATSQLDW